MRLLPSGSGCPEDGPLVLVLRVRRLDRAALRLDLVDDVDQVLQRQVLRVRVVAAAPADVQSHPALGTVADRVVEGLDAQVGPLAVLLDRELRVHLEAVRQVGVVELENEAGVRDRLVLVVHRVGDREEELFLRP